MTDKVAIWEAVNQYVRTCGGDPSRNVYGNNARMRAVVNVDLAIGAFSSLQQAEMIQELNKTIAETQCRLSTALDINESCAESETVARAERAEQRVAELEKILELPSGPYDFDRAWASTGRQYGPEELEGVRLGWDMRGKASDNRAAYYTGALYGAIERLSTVEGYAEIREIIASMKDVLKKGETL